jgi:hypothetical protein
MSSPSLDNPTSSLVGVVPIRLAIWMAFATVFLWSGFEKLYHIGSNFDWYLFTHHLDVARRTFVAYGQLPVWNPYYCGGIPELGNLQASAVAPVNLLMAAFGTVPGMKLGLWLFLVLGQEGTYRYARHHGVEGFGGIVAAAAFAFSGRFASPIVNGHPMFFGFLFMPWVFLGLEKGVRSWWWGVLGGLFMAWIFAKGGAVPTPMISVVLVVLTGMLTARSIWEGQEGDFPWYRPTLTLVGMALVTCAIAAVRAIPVAETLLEVPRTLQSMESYSLTHVTKMLFVQTPGPPESYNGTATSYIGLAVFGFAVYPLFFGDRRAGRMFFLTLLFYMLSMGGQSPLGLYHGLKSLPIFENLRAPFRYTNFVVFFLAVGAGHGIALLEHQSMAVFERLRPGEWLERWQYAPTIYWGVSALVTSMLVLGVGAAVVVPEFRFNKARVDETFTVEWARSYDQPFRQSIGNRWHANVWPTISRGSLACWEAQPFFQSPALRADLEQEEFLKDDAKGRIERLSWSPHRIVLDVSVDEEARVIVNQNKHRAWTSNVGTVTSDRGRLAIDVPEGDHRLVVEFSDPLVWWGLVVSILTALAIVGFGARRLWLAWSEGDSDET